MSMETPKKKRRTKKEWLQIIKEVEKEGRKATLSKYDIYPATYNYQRKKYSEMGAEGLEHGMTKERQAKLRKLEKENKMLKELLAEKELESRLKDDLLKEFEDYGGYPS